MARHMNSALVCDLSGELIDEDNPPLMLPNGHVYGSKVCVSAYCSLYTYVRICD